MRSSTYQRVAVVSICILTIMSLFMSHDILHSETFSGEDHCSTLESERFNTINKKKFESGAYDMLLLTRSSTHGICTTAAGEAPVICNRLASTLLPLVVTGLQPIYSHCSLHDGYHWPQYCERGSLHSYSSSPFSELFLEDESQESHSDAKCLKDHAELCKDRMLQVWPHLTSSDQFSGAWYRRIWEQYGTCSRLSVEDYFYSSLLAEEAASVYDSWEDLLPHIFNKPFSLRLLESVFGGHFGAMLYCEKDSRSGKVFLTNISTCIKPPGRGFPEPTVCPHWLRDEKSSCHPYRGIRGGAEIWL